MINVYLCFSNSQLLGFVLLFVFHCFIELEVWPLSVADFSPRFPGNPHPHPHPYLHRKICCYARTRTVGGRGRGFRPNWPVNIVLKYLIGRQMEKLNSLGGGIYQRRTFILTQYSQWQSARIVQGNFLYTSHACHQLYFT